jgi:tryptophan synthase beta chain
MLGTPAKIFYKYEGVSPAGSHKPNSAVPQAYLNKIAGTKRLITETGAGQWGSSLSFAGQCFGLPVEVYMVKVSYNQKPYRRLMMQTWGGDVVASPSDRTKTGRDILAADPDNQGSLGIAISEAIEAVVSNPGSKYALGSVLNHVLLHQTVIGLEAKKQFEKIRRVPGHDVRALRRRLQLRRRDLPLPRRRRGGRQARAEDPHGRGRAGVLPDADQGRVCL